MKTIGLLGGMSWQSTLAYYRAINEATHAALGGLHSAKIVMYSVDFEQIAVLQQQGDWQATTKILIEAAQNVQSAGAELLLICTNTMHKVAPQIEAAIDIPLLHIADTTAEAAITDNADTLGLLGTAFTMEDDFYTARLREKHGLKVLVPDRQDRQIIHDVIYQELCVGIVSHRSKTHYLRIIESLARQGAVAVILGCTEIGLLVNQSDTGVLLLDTAHIHAQKAVDWALNIA